MAKHFDFNEDDNQEEIEKKHFAFDDEDTKEVVVNNEPQVVEEPKKKKAWLIALVLIILAVGAGGIYFINFMINDNKPVLGARCEGIQEISPEVISKTKKKLEKNANIKSVNMEIFCKELRIDIVYKKGTTVKKAKSLAKKTVKTLDSYTGKKKSKNSSYSDLFGTHENVTQYEVELYLTCSGNKKFPIYGTKHTNSNKFSYTTAGVKDKKTYKRVKKK